MSRLGYYVTKNSTIEMGEIIGVLVGSSNTTPTSNLQVSGDFVQCGQAYEENSYPNLYRWLGKPRSTTFTARSSNTASNIEVIYGNGTYVYYGTGGLIATSTNGINWTTRNSGTTFNINALIYGNNKYLYTVSGGLMVTSTDAVTWGASSVLIPGIGYEALLYANNLYLAGYDRLYTSTDAVTWTYLSNGPAVSYVFDLCYGNGLYVAVGSTTLIQNYGPAQISTSPTPAVTNSWSSRTPAHSAGIYSVTYGNGIYVYGGAGGNIASSTNAITWTARNSGTSSTIYSVEYGNNIFTYAGAGGAAATSTDGITWTPRTTGTPNQINSLIYGSNTFVYATASGGISTSPDIASNDPNVFLYGNLTDSQFYVPTATTLLNPSVTTINTLYSNSGYVSYMRGR